jgi:hypothetical protein
VSRAERVARAQELSGTSSLADIAAELGVSIHTVRSYLTDPDLSKLRARKQRYAGTCISCGGPTDGTNGRDHASVRCARCAIEHQRSSARWTRETVRVAIRDWWRRFGRPPRASDWRTRTRIRELGVRNTTAWPLTSTVQALYDGSWNAAIEDAGLPTLRPGQYPRVRSAK